VVYRVIVSTPNDDLRLLPYLSARVEFEINRRPDALLVTNAAMRYTPRPELVTTAPAAKAENAEVADAAEPATEVLTADSTESKKTVWVRQGNKVYPVDVEVGLTDGVQSEITGGDLQPGMEVVLGEEIAEVSTETTNPLAPPRFRGKKKS
jgi:HlyD family secretion protein